MSEKKVQGAASALNAAPLPAPGNRFLGFQRKNYLKWKTIPVETRKLFCV
jgi:hypothetical protein